MKVYINEYLKNWTSFRIGGKADVIAEPMNKTELVELIKFLRENNIKFYILGNGSNILVSDKGVRGCVVYLGDNYAKIDVVGKKIEAEAGATIKELANCAYENNLTGMEELSGIPGTLGGAIVMNAGAYGKEIKDIISYVNILDENNKIVKLNSDELNFSYRKSNISDRNYIVLSACLSLQDGEKQNIKFDMEKYKSWRETKQPLEFPSAGSVFKRPNLGNKFAAQLIEESFLKGETIGGAQISEKHAGFIINIGEASSNDVAKLIKIITENVFTYHNVSLEPEIKFWGKF